MVSSLPTDPCLCSEYTPSLPEHILTAALEIMHKELPQSSGRCGLSTCGVMGSHRHGREIPECGTPRGLWLNFLLNAVIRNQSPLMPLDNFICLFPDLLPPPSHGSPASVLL